MDEVILKIRELLETEFTTTYKKYYYGEHPLSTQSFFPFLEVVPVGTDITQRGTGGCKNNILNIEVRMKDSLKNYLKNDTNVEIVDYMQTAVKRMEKRTSRNIDDDSILGVLNNNLRLDGAGDIIDNFNISYDILPLGESYVIISTVSFQVALLSH